MSPTSPRPWMISTSPSALPPRDGASSALTAMVPCVLPRRADTDMLWEAFRRLAGLDHDKYVVGSFDGSPEMATELANFGHHRDREGRGQLDTRLRWVAEPTPRPDDLVITLDDESHPRFIWRTTEVTSKPLSQVIGICLRTSATVARVVARCLPSLFRSASESELRVMLRGLRNEEEAPRAAVDHR
jgi:hypothetical protein